MNSSMLTIRVGASARKCQNSIQVCAWLHISGNGARLTGDSPGCALVDKLDQLICASVPTWGAYFWLLSPRFVVFQG